MRIKMICVSLYMEMWALFPKPKKEEKNKWRPQIRTRISDKLEKKTFFFFLNYCVPELVYRKCEEQTKEKNESKDWIKQRTNKRKKLNNEKIKIVIDENWNRTKK